MSDDKTKKDDTSVRDDLLLVLSGLGGALAGRKVMKRLSRHLPKQDRRAIKSFGTVGGGGAGALGFAMLDGNLKPQWEIDREQAQKRSRRK